jgi:hypothetical protein
VNWQLAKTWDGLPAVTTEFSEPDSSPGFRSNKISVMISKRANPGLEMVGIIGGYAAVRFDAARSIKRDGSLPDGVGGYALHLVTTKKSPPE